MGANLPSATEDSGNLLGTTQLHGNARLKRSACAENNAPRVGGADSCAESARPAIRNGKTGRPYRANSASMGPAAIGLPPGKKIMDPTDARAIRSDGAFLLGADR